MTDKEPVELLFWRDFYKVKACMPAVVMTENNPHFKSKYENLNGVITALEAAIKKAGVPISWHQHIDYLGNNVMQVTTTFTRIGESSVFHNSWVTRFPMGKESIHEGGACSTYTKRQALKAILGIVGVHEDKDGNVEHEEPDDDKIIFDIKNKVQKEWLCKKLEERKVPDAYWSVIAAKLSGKDIALAGKITEEIMKGTK